MIIKSGLVAAAVALVVYVGAVIMSPDTAAMAAVLDTAWGRVLLADFYLGVLCFAAVIHAVEQRLLPTLGWSLALALLGFPIAVVWLLLRGLERINGSLGRQVSER
ncbi:MAG: hypothetical protein JJT88_05190 [Gammaproteobacteria bacterium]|nr:hypothetical protein [Gammaproteobacteria bacterium]